MLNPAVENIIEKGQSRYSLVVAVAKRAREIAEIAIKQNDISTEKPVKLAIVDFAAKKYTFEECQDD